MANRNVTKSHTHEMMNGYGHHLWRTNVIFALEAALVKVNGRKSVALVAVVLIGAGLLSWAQFDTNAIDAAYNAAIEKIGSRRAQLKTLAGRAIRQANKREQRR
ncbi:hypothetical protein BIW11_04175 [Tropilaelaps mercedesae]|uniref:Uncharacterized protein n=1 Tax=Tropilaelaps mercedesae TaxID=418985 RepID=A0A1V9XAF6_9ACAR|nr:hypothetical protein BIW11_04175 [Tropilaelaps mercedesae]